MEMMVMSSSLHSRLADESVTAKADLISVSILLYGSLSVAGKSDESSIAMLNVSCDTSATFPAQTIPMQTSFIVWSSPSSHDMPVVMAAQADVTTGLALLLQFVGSADLPSALIQVTSRETEDTSAPQMRGQVGKLERTDHP
jgi:hypothetical protein